MVAAKNNAIIAALSSTFLISLAPNAFLLLFPHYASGEGESSQILTLGQALAAGGLLGDVFLHTIPHTATNGSHDTGLWIILGFTIFFVADLLLRALGGGHSHEHSHDSGKRSQKENNNNNRDHNGHHRQHGSTHQVGTIALNLAADSLHNFTDGLAIGASFASVAGSGAGADKSVLELMKSRGGLATLSILFHEIPHELGDFAILVKNGYSKNQAIMAQFGTALAALAGTIVGILLDGFAGNDTLVLITSGGFVYLAAVTILPEILEDQSTTTIKYRFAQLMYFLVGIAFMYAVGLLEEMDPDGHHGHSHGHHHHDVHDVSSHNHHEHHEHHDHHDHIEHAHELHEHDHHHERHSEL